MTSQAKMVGRKKTFPMRERLFYARRQRMLGFYLELAAQVSQGLAVGFGRVVLLKLGV